MNPTSKGLSAALFCFFIWGSFPLFFSLLSHVPASEVLVHRVVWSLLLTGLILSIRHQWHSVLITFRQPPLLMALLASSLLIAANWGVYIWAVGQSRVVEASLGYFINPLVSVALGVLFLQERLAPYQKLAIVLALAGVLFRVVDAGVFPWISLVLAFSFGLYGLVRKQTPVDTVTGLTVETLLLLPLALGYWSWLALQGGQHFHADGTGLLLVGAGFLTAVPLLAFSIAARNLSLTVLGFMTYLTPSLQLLSAVVILGEPFQSGDWISFALIWAGLLVLSLGAMLSRRRRFPPEP